MLELWICSRCWRCGLTNFSHGFDPMLMQVMDIKFPVVNIPHECVKDNEVPQAFW